METVFIKIVNMSISAGWLVLAVIVARFLLKKAPKWVSVLLWGLVGLRLVMPFTIKSGFSLLPSAEVISPSIGYAKNPTIYSGISAFDNAVNPVLGATLTANPGDSANPMQVWIFFSALFGPLELLFYLPMVLSVTLGCTKGFQKRHSCKRMCGFVIEWKRLLSWGFSYREYICLQVWMKKIWSMSFHMKRRIFGGRIISGNLLDSCFFPYTGLIRSYGLPIFFCARTWKWHAMRR